MKSTLFRRYLNSGDIPISNRTEINLLLKARKMKKSDHKRLLLQWSISPAKLDYCYYFPIMMEGLADPNEKNRVLAETAAREMILHNPERVSL